MEVIQQFAQLTGIYAFMNSPWGWPVVESLHFIGLSLLLGTVGVFDLRLIGVARGISLDALHPLIRWGVLGYALNVSTGIMFFVSAPDQYLFNPAFQTKLSLMLLAGVNMLLFYKTVAPAARATATGENALSLARLFGTVSLLCWCGIIICGRLITYYRPPYHWCLWCS